MKQLWYCELVGSTYAIRCDATLDNGRQAGTYKAMPSHRFHESFVSIRAWLALQIVIMQGEINRLNDTVKIAPIVTRVDHATRSYHRITGVLPNVVYVGHAEWRDIPMNTGAYRNDGHSEWFMNLRIIRVDLPEWLQVTRVWGDV